MGVHRNEKINFVKSFLNSLINGSTQEKIIEKYLTCLFFLHHINA